MSNLHTRSFSTGLSELPRLDKLMFIYSYIKEQKLHAKSYELEGRTLLLSWNRSLLESCAPQLQTHAIQPPLEFGFGTPILKPRAESGKPRSEIMKEQTSNDSTIQDRVGKSIVQKKKNRKRKRASTVMSGEVLTHESRQRAIRVKGRGMNHHDTVRSEQDDRLRERRERRRAKHAATMPIKVSNELESERVVKDRKKTKRKKEKLKGPAGLALMHGFSATNVGLGRLTMKRPVGVFNKGRASVKNGVNPEKMGKVKEQCSAIFSEAAFLMGARSEREPPSTSASPIPTSETGHSTLDRGPTPCLDAKFSRPESDHQISPGKLDIFLDRVSLVEGSSQNTAARAESIVWDIELDNAFLPSQAPLDLGKANISFDIRKFSWAGQQSDSVPASPNSRTNPAPRTAVHTSEVPKVYRDANNRHILSSPSIGPSQSASQCHLPEPLINPRPQPFTLSRYFINNQSRSPAHTESFEVIPTHRSEAGRQNSVILFRNPVSVFGTAEEFYEVSPLYQANKDEAKYDIAIEMFDEDNYNTYLTPEGFEGSKSDPSSVDVKVCNQCPSSRGKETTLNQIFANDNNGNPQVICETFDTRSSFESFRNTPSSPSCPRIGIDHTVAGTVTPTHHTTILYPDFETSREINYRANFSSNGDYCDCLSTEPSQIALDIDLDFPSGTSGELEMDGHSLIYATSQFLKGRKLLLDYWHNDSSEKSLIPGKMKDRRPMSLVEADVAKSLKNHWVPQKL